MIDCQRRINKVSNGRKRTFCTRQTRYLIILKSQVNIYPLSGPPQFLPLGTRRMAGARFSKVRSSQNINGPGTVQTGSGGRAFLFTFKIEVSRLFQ